MLYNQCLDTYFHQPRLSKMIRWIPRYGYCQEATLHIVYEKYRQLHVSTTKSIRDSALEDPAQ
jgi:hypothetical protein